MNKKIAIALFLCYSILLSVVITFTFGLGDRIVKLTKNITEKVEITDVTVDISDSYVVGKQYSPKYTAVGRYRDPKLVFEALDDTLTVNKETGAFKGKRTDANETSGRLRITSEADPNFEKIINLKFEKKYPDDISAGYFAKSVGYLKSKIYKDIPLNFYMKIPKGQVYSESDCQLIYDKEYFTQIDENTLLPIKATEKGKTLSVTLLLGNGKSFTTKEFTIASLSAPIEDFDSVELEKVGNERANTVGSVYAVYLIKDGERVYSDYEISFRDGLAKLNSVGNVVLKKLGTEEITVTLPNGFSRSVTVDIKNHLEFPSLDGEFNKKGELILKRYNKLSLTAAFPSDATYKSFDVECDSEVFTVKKIGNTLELKNTKLGKGEIKLIVDDGKDRIEKTITVKVVPQLNPYEFLKDSPDRFVSKVFGHTFGFAVMAIFALNMFRFIKIKNKLFRLFTYSYAAFVFAFITEFIQYFIPGRTSSFSDLLVDMVGYYIGTLITIGICCLVKWLKGRKNKTAKATELTAKE
ncbi:MAG: VanZ family protein [Ruminococcaceae bacterium]|nr:VanZ family protein [Oscillospiraceae bacterium]